MQGGVKRKIIVGLRILGVLSLSNVYNNNNNSLFFKRLIKTYVFLSVKQ